MLKLTSRKIWKLSWTFIKVQSITRINFKILSEFTAEIFSLKVDRRASFRTIPLYTFFCIKIKTFAHHWNSNDPLSLLGNSVNDVAFEISLAILIVAGLCRCLVAAAARAQIKIAICRIASAQRTGRTLERTKNPVHYRTILSVDVLTIRRHGISSVYGPSFVRNVIRFPLDFITKIKTYEIKVSGLNRKKLERMNYRRK